MEEIQEVLQYSINGKDLVEAYNSAAYAFACYGLDESDEFCEEIFEVSSVEVYKAQFEIEKMPISKILEHLELQ